MKVTEELKAIVAFSLLENMGPVTFKRLLETFGSVSNIFKAPENKLKKFRGPRAIDYSALKSKRLFEMAEEEIKKAESEGVEIISQLDERYPVALKEIHDPPILLYVKGHLPLESVPKVAVVGSRIASLYGKRTAESISRGLAEAGVAVVSGMAVGIDSAAHQGALSANGITLAVLGGGLSRLYPHENKKMADAIVKKGAVLSEYPMEMPPRPEYFPVRNRIISGLSSAVLVVEAKEKSGALITVDLALEQGRDVFAVPGNVDSARSGGTNSLLKQGAKFAMSAEDILEELNIKRGSMPARGEKREGREPELAARRARGVPLPRPTCREQELAANLSEEENNILSLINSEPAHVDSLIEHSGASASKTIAALSLLEIKGFLKQLPGKHYVKTHA